MSKFVDNLIIAVRKTENGHVVYHKYPQDEELDYEQPVHKHAFEWERDPHFKETDSFRCLYYHLGCIIDEAAKHMVGQDYDIEVIVTPKGKADDTTAAT